LLFFTMVVSYFVAFNSRFCGFCTFAGGRGPHKRGEVLRARQIVPTFYVGPLIKYPG
jgi:hypothetical protein